MAGIEIKATGITSTAQVGDGVIVTADIADGAATAAKIGADVGFSSLPAENISDEPVNGQIAKYNFATGKWENSSSLAVTLTVRSLAKAAMDEIVLAEGELAYVTDTKEVRVGDEAETAGGIAVDTVISGTRVLGVNAGGSAIENAVSLRAVYAIAKTMTPLVTDRVLILLPPGKYDFVLGDVDDLNHGLELDTEFIDLEGMTGNPEDVILTSQIATASRGTVEQTADDVKMRGFAMDIESASGVGSLGTKPAAYFPTTALGSTELIDIAYSSQNANSYAMRASIDYSGVFTNCVVGNQGFGYGGTVSGTFTNCKGGNECFGYFGTASGVFANCVGGSSCFGANGVANGIFIACVGESSSFGSNASTSAAVMRRCRSTGRSDAIKNWQGLMIDCEIEVTGVNKHAVEVTDSNARIYNSVLIANGTGNSVYAASAFNAKIANVLTNKAVHGNVTNLIAAPNVIVDAEVSL